MLSSILSQTSPVAGRDARYTGAISPRTAFVRQVQEGNSCALKSITALKLSYARAPRWVEKNKFATAHLFLLLTTR